MPRDWNSRSPVRIPQEPDAELRDIPRDECLLLIATVPVGRLAVVGQNGAPHVVPVNFVVDGDRIYFRSDEGTKLTAALAQLCTFQADMIDAYRHTGWTVLIHGHVANAESLPSHLDSWLRPGRHVLCMHPTEVSGRRIALADVPLDGRGYL
jgi:hypothetical protein